MELRAGAFSGALKKAIENHKRLAAEAAKAEQAHDAAAVGLEQAKQADMDDAVHARVGGKDAPARTNEQSAQDALKSAAWEAEVTQRAALAALDAMAWEAQQPEHDERLAAEEDKLLQAALAALASVEGLLDKVAEARANRRWLKQPVRNESVLEPNVQGVWLGTAHKPNGESMVASELIAPLREALRGADQPSTQNDWGIPAGAILPVYTEEGGWAPAMPSPGSAAYDAMHGTGGDAVIAGAAARVFEEQAGE